MRPGSGATALPAGLSAGAAMDRSAGADARLTGLDALRGIAAIFVLGYHAWTEFGVFPVFARSYLAVDFFFMLSGFVMALTYEARLVSGSLPARKFMAVRYRRLWGPIAAGTAIGLVFHIVSGSRIELHAIVFGVLLIPDLGAVKPYLLNRPAWSIFFELLANLLHAVLLSRVRTRFVIALAAGSAMILFLHSTAMGAIVTGIRSADFAAGVPRVLMAYCIGIALWRLRRRFAVPAQAAPVLLVAGLLLVPAGLGWDFAFVVLLCPALIVFGTGSFGGRAATLLGGLSFPLYATHFPVMQLCQFLGFGAVFAVAIALAVAILVGLLVDGRLRRLAA